MTQYSRNTHTQYSTDREQFNPFQPKCCSSFDRRFRPWSQTLSRPASQNQAAALLTQEWGAVCGMVKNSWDLHKYDNDNLSVGIGSVTFNQILLASFNIT
jgi:hypothetical protein